MAGHLMPDQSCHFPWHDTILRDFPPQSARQQWDAFWKTRGYANLTDRL